MKFLERYNRKDKTAFSRVYLQIWNTWSKRFRTCSWSLWFCEPRAFLLAPAFNARSSGRFVLIQSKNKRTVQNSMKGVLSLGSLFDEEWYFSTTECKPSCSPRHDERHFTLNTFAVSQKLQSSPTTFVCSANKGTFSSLEHIQFVNTFAQINSKKRKISHELSTKWKVGGWELPCVKRCLPLLVQEKYGTAFTNVSKVLQQSTL